MKAPFLSETLQHPTGCWNSRSGGAISLIDPKSIPIYIVVSVNIYIYIYESLSDLGVDRKRPYVECLVQNYRSLRLQVNKNDV